MPHGEHRAAGGHGAAFSSGPPMATVYLESPEAPGEGPSCLFHLLGVQESLDLGLHPSLLCLCIHMTSPLCLCLPLSCKDSHRGLELP